MKLLSIPVALALLAISSPALAAPKAHRPAPAPAAIQQVGVYPAGPDAAMPAPDAQLPVLQDPNAAASAMLPAPGAKPEYRQPRAHRQPQAMPPALPE